MAFAAAAATVAERRYGVIDGRRTACICISHAPATERLGPQLIVALPCSSGAPGAQLWRTHSVATTDGNEFPFHLTQIDLRYRSSLRKAPLKG